jgi:hypothetical protein
MNTNALLALGMAAALAWGAAPAATYLCTRDPADPSSLVCEKAPRDERPYGPAAEQSVVPPSAIVAYSLMVGDAASDPVAIAAPTPARPGAAPPPSLATYDAARSGGNGS